MTSGLAVRSAAARLRRSSFSTAGLQVFGVAFALIGFWGSDAAYQSPIQSIISLVAALSVWLIGYIPTYIVVRFWTSSWKNPRSS